MAIWKKSEDPWDRKAGRDWLDQKKPKEPRENPIDSLKQWNEDRKAAAKEKEEAKRLPPEPCPWCGKDMEQGYLLNGQGIRWAPGVPNFVAKWISTDFVKGAFRVDNDGGFFTYKTTWFCRECGKMVFDVPEEERVFDFPKDQDSEASEITQEEEESED